MQLSLTCRHCEATPAIRRYIDARMSRLNRFSDKIAKVQVTLTTEKHGNTAEIVLRADGKEFTSKDQSEDLFSAVDRVSDKLEKQLRRFKRRKQAARKNGSRAPEIPLSATLRVVRAGTAGSGENAHEVIDASDQPLEAMTVDEAILKLEQTGAPFLVFASRTTDLIHVVYKTPEGDYAVMNLHAVL